MVKETIRTFWPIFLVIIISASSYGAAKVTINDVKEKVDVNIQKIQAIEIKQTEIHTDVKWIKKYLESKQ